jgi:hypothetical protein
LFTVLTTTNPGRSAAGRDRHYTGASAIILKGNYKRRVPLIIRLG